MAAKYEEIKRLAYDTARLVSGNEDEWKKYLRTAAKLYRYSFKEQLLIHAQRPEATACATAEQWSGKMNCWVNRGSKGIALIDEDSPYKKLRYVFDMSDVHPSRLVGRLPRIWEMKEGDAGAVIDRLERSYGITDNALSFAERIIEIAGRVAEDSYGDMIPEIKVHSAKTRMDGLDDGEIGRRAYSAVRSSVAYTLLVRCGIDAEKWEGRLDFLMDQMAKQEGVDWRMRNERQMEWVRRMNGIKARAEEVVLSELIYS